MPRSSGGRLLAEIGVGGHGRRNIVNDENQNWWCPTIKQPPPATITSTIQPAFQQSRNQVIDYPSLSTLLQNQSAYHIKMAEKCDSFLEQALLEKSVMQPLIVMSSETYWLASAVKIACLTCQKNSNLQEALAVGFWSTQGNFTAVEEKVGERKWQPLLLLWKRLVGRKYIKH